MAVGFGAGSNATFAASVASYTVTLNTTGARCGLIFALTYANAGASIFTGATIGGVTAPKVVGSDASDTATEPGHVEAYFLDNIAVGATTAFVATRTNNTVVAGIWAISFTAAKACSVVGVKVIQEDAAYAEQSIDDSGADAASMRAACGFYGGATPQPVGANTTIVGAADDQTAFGSNCGRETTAGTGARLVGFTQATSDDHAEVLLAVREVPAPTPDIVIAVPIWNTARG